MIDRGREHGLRHYLFGATPTVLERLEQNLLERFPGAQIVGTSSPPFRAMNAPEEREAVAAITAASPHIVWVGLGHAEAGPLDAPALARPRRACSPWASAPRSTSSPATARARPMWMQESGLEWVHRMVHDPIKLAPRYAAANTIFIASTIAEVTRDTVGAARPSR